MVLLRLRLRSVREYCAVWAVVHVFRRGLHRTTRSHSLLRPRWAGQGFSGTITAVICVSRACSDVVGSAITAAANATAAAENCVEFDWRVLKWV